MLTAATPISLPAPAALHRDPPHPVTGEALHEAAARLWPHSQHNQARWMRSVRHLRAGSGWILDPWTKARPGLWQR